MRPRRRIRWLTLVLVAGLFAAACGSSESAGELLPFSRVQDSEFAFDADPTDPNRGVFRVRTTEPMICAIVWGETEEFGNFNNSLSMNGTGIIDHDVILPGAEPGTEYFFRVQGSTADGEQYRSEIGTFTIPETDGADGASSEEEPPHGPNLALDATVVDVSSVFGSGWEAENAIDDDTGTEWASAGDGDSGFITIDLGSPQSVVGVEFLTRSMLDGTAATEMYTVIVDGDQTFGPFPAGTPANPRFTPVEFTGQEIRFEVESSTGGNVGAIELGAFSPAVVGGG